MAGAEEQKQAAIVRRRRACEALPPVTLWLLVGLVVGGVVLAAVLFDAASRVFLVKVASIGLLSGLPAWLYLQFIASRGFSLYDDYVLNLFRLHVDAPENLPAPPVHTSYHSVWKAAHVRLGTRTTDNLYRRKFEAVYGRASVSTRALFAGHTRLRDRAEAFSPVLLATLVFALGWSLVLEPELYRSFRLLDEAASARPDLPVAALQYGFLGAYAFVLQDLVRRYFRDDLRAGAYVGAIVRIVFVVILVAALGLVWPAELPQGQQTVFAFFVGLFPQAGLQALRAAAARPVRKWVPSVATDQPLAQLDGLNIWFEARLLEEGIEDLQNLVSANIVDLLLHTRVPVTRLVDWIDQACLLLHLPAREDGQPDLRPALRRLGVRTATDLQVLWQDEVCRAALVQEFAAVLGGDDARAHRVLAALCASLEGHLNLWHVAQFRQGAWLLASGDRRDDAPATPPAIPRPPAPSAAYDVALLSDTSTAVSWATT